MERLTTTPFGRRPVTAGHLAAQALADAPTPCPRVPKWELFRTLCAARPAFGVGDRALTVLAALLSFLPGDDLADDAGLIVFPSNAALSARAHGMAEATLRRHLAALAAAGLILRHDSPNGKRYAARGADGTVLRAFGFDLRPLLVRAQEISAAAQAADEAEARRKRLREACVLIVRDAVKLLCYGRDAGLPGDWPAWDAVLRDCQRRLRRKADIAALEAVQREAEHVLETVCLACRTEELSGKPADSERHQQNSKPETIESEPCHEHGRAAAVDDPAQLQPHVSAEVPERDPDRPALPFGLVLRACPGFAELSDRPLRRWHDLVAHAAVLRPMLGISPDAWDAAGRAMGPENAASVLAAMVERGESIANPGGYLRALTAKARAAAFSPVPMVMACLNRSTSAAA